MSTKLFKNLRLVHSDFLQISGGMAFTTEKGLVSWIGPQNKVPKRKNFSNEIDLKNKIVFPSFIECHTHSVFAGSRADEFEQRNQGLSYLEIAARGGGILSTMKKTRLATSTELLKKSQLHVDHFLRQGVSTLEIKSGYALDLKNEIKMLKVIKALKGPRIISTFLGAHTLPAEFKTTQDYLYFLSTQVLPVVKKKKLADRVDIFVEKKFFELPQASLYFKAAEELGFSLTVHANQLSNSGGVDLALNFNAQSADHVIHLNQKQIETFSKSKTVAVLLPAADLYMKCAYPPARQLIDAGTTVALATDFNPGSCPTQDLSLVGVLARLEMKMTLPEVFRAYTSGAAKALGIQDEEGDLAVGKKANFICTDADLSDFFYSVGSMPNHQLFIQGRQIKI